MIANTEKKEELKFNDSPGVNSKGQSVLGTLEGYCADIVNPTRNGRKYSEELWEKVFNSKIVKELFNCGGILGELDHPEDRQEICTEKVAICMPEPPIKKDGKLWAKFDILDTPNGRIAATLAKYGYKLGVSSRGSGDTIIDSDGNESVDPDSYDFTCFDLVVLPAVEAARLQFKESFNKNKSLKQALSESLKNASSDDRKIMQETLANLNIDIDSNIDSEDTSNTADNTRVIVEELQKAIKEKEQLENQVISLQEKLSVCYTKETANEEKLEKYKNTISKLSDDAKNSIILEKKVESLNNKVSALNCLIASKDKLLNKYQATQSSLTESKKSLIESASKKTETIKTLTEDLSNLKISFENEKVKLNETIQSLTKDLHLCKSNYSKNLDAANNLVEKYKKIATSAVNKYIQSKAQMVGISIEEIKNRLPESYSFSDIDSICEDLQNYRLTIDKLPFQTLKLNENTKMKINAVKDNQIMQHSNFDDEIDEQLSRLSN